MTRFLLAVVMLLPLTLAGCGKPNLTQAQSLVDRATLTVQDMMNQTVSKDPRLLLRRAKAVMICPRLFKAGFVFAGEGGGCVLLTRSGNGTWSYPAFYNMGSGSFGLQAGIKDSALMMMVMTERGLNALLDSQVKLGADASIAVATVGATVQGATTAAVGADIVAVAYSRGLFAGVSLDGSLMSSRTEWDQTYYGQPFAARQIVMAMQAVNRGADPLREVLTRYGEGSGAGSPPVASQGGPGYAPAYPPANAGPTYQQPQTTYRSAPTDAAPSYAPNGPGYAPQTEPGGAPPIQQQTLAPPRS